MFIFQHLSEVRNFPIHWMMALIFTAFKTHTSRRIGIVSTKYSIWTNWWIKVSILWAYIQSNCRGIGWDNPLFVQIWVLLEFTHVQPRYPDLKMIYVDQCKIQHFSFFTPIWAVSLLDTNYFTTQTKIWLLKSDGKRHWLPFNSLQMIQYLQSQLQLGRAFKPRVIHKTAWHIMKHHFTTNSVLY